MSLLLSRQPLRDRCKHRMITMTLSEEPDDPPHPSHVSVEQSIPQHWRCLYKSFPDQRRSWILNPNPFQTTSMRTSADKKWYARTLSTSKALGYNTFGAGGFFGDSEKAGKICRLQPVAWVKLANLDEILRKFPCGKFGGKSFSETYYCFHAKRNKTETVLNPMFFSSTGSRSCHKLFGTQLLTLQMNEGISIYISAIPIPLTYPVATLSPLTIRYVPEDCGTYQNIQKWRRDEKE